ncbi:hypothetical protein [Pontibaca methylaminivorans]|uniref:Uncharacterized protein n=1 Tax=Pontibaca methylaminivorans TaxID=515897 RepID=A0A1R3W9W6_9RHOB|nr:hypothetical protein [Pontibaca methylaminivorans]SIT74793.1 hypothetical protein SAMN05421849_0214 [Pontibaca methylaminivorans]
MWVFYDSASGEIQYTLVASDDLTLPDGDRVWSDDPIDDSRAWKVQEGELAHTGLSSELLREGVSLSRVELAKRLRQFEILTAEDAKRVARGEWPEVLLPMLAQMPQEVIDDAEIELAGATEFERLHPTILLFQQAMGISDAVADEVFGIVA